MIWTRSLLCSLARTLAGLLLFAQLATAAHACTLAWNALPETAASTSTSTPAVAHCHEAPAVDSSLLCARHCHADEQSPSAASPSVAPMPAIAVLVVPALAPARGSGANGIASANDIAPATDPPPAILFHAFRS